MSLEGWRDVFANGNTLFLLRGLLVTVELFAISGIASMILGAALASYRSLCRGLWRWPAALYVGAFRNLPVLVVMFFVRFGLPLVGVNVTSAVVAALIALVAYNAAMVAELLRGAIDSVGTGQTEAALATGCSRWLAFYRVVFRQALTSSLPALIGQFIVLLQGTSLVTALGVPDLTNNATIIYSRYVNPLETLIVVIAAYYVMCSALAQMRRVLERRMGQA